MSWRASILTIFPEMFPGPLGHSLTGKALDDGLWQLDAVDIRQFATDKHRSVDDQPFGGGAGMVMRADILAAALDHAADQGACGPRIYLSPRGRPFDQVMARQWSAEPGVTLLAGRYEGVDQRLLDARGFIEVSLGDYVLSGGEIAAMAMIDACVRLLDGVLGNSDSLAEESFSEGLLEYPHFTRPSMWEGREVPQVLKSGHHEKIRAWRRGMSVDITRERRPDLLIKHAERPAFAGDRKVVS